ncbi:hypothetical protein [Deinococcus sp. DB0503]|uniref:hypothetical protein n=1 Tax=Deinococcus sp. DB0503 TaxID=2479203 RepID=UPI0018DFA1A7|nr:hypothetical protein [Deinococcus sp. DB0503]
MRGSQRTEGAAMILVVLLTLLLLSGILAATLRLGLGSRQNTADQAATLRAQYVAESGLALAQSWLRDVQTMLSPAENGATPGLFLAPNIRVSAVRTWIDQLCGTGTWTALNEGINGGPGFFDPDGNDGAGRNYPTAQACVPTNLNSDDNFTLFAKLVTPASYNALPASEQPGATEAARKAFWRRVLTQAQSRANGDLGSSTTTSLSLTRILRLGPDHHRVFVRVASLTASADANANSRRIITAQGARDGEWWFDVLQPSLLDAVVQTDYHTMVSGGPVNFTTTTSFQGQIKTNDIFTFTSQSGYNSPRFSGKISSAGCTSRTQTAEEESCVRRPGVRVDGSVFRYPLDSTLTDEQKSDGIRSYISNNRVNVNYSGVTPNYASQYQPFPRAALIQENAANGLDADGNPLSDNSRGLILGNGVIGIQMFVGDGDMNPPNSYDSAQRRWVEATPSYQYLRPIVSQNCVEQLGGTCTYTYSNTIYRVDDRKRIYSKTGNGSWILLPNPFNGVIFKAAGSEPLTLVGPDPGRLSTGTQEGRVRPAVASFSGITVATPRQIDIRSDLALSQSPCRYDEYDSVSLNPPCKERENVLGLFSSAGKIVVRRQVPNNAVIHAALMASQQEFMVEGYDSGAYRGEMLFTGSMVERYYGASGTTSGTGYGRDYSHDKRFLDGLTPPFYPTSPKWSFEDAGTKRDLTRVLWKQGS